MYPAVAGASYSGDHTEDACTDRRRHHVRQTAPVDTGGLQSV
jgi:hypothetical protein